MTLGLSEGHVSTACLAIDGTVVAAASEERFTRLKGLAGFPAEAVEYCLTSQGLAAADIDAVVLSTRNPWTHFQGGRRERGEDGSTQAITGLVDRLHRGVGGLFGSGRAGKILYQVAYEVGFRPLVWSRLDARRMSETAENVSLSRSRVQAADHHLCHAVAAVACSGGLLDSRAAVLTLDGAGDDCCASVWEYDGRMLTRLARTPNSNSIGDVYEAVTRALGLDTLDDQFKVMGLAGYPSEESYRSILRDLQKLIRVEGLQFHSSLSTRHCLGRVMRIARGNRFDNVAAAVQVLLQNLLLEWVTNALNAVGTRQVYCGGGVFLNVKANGFLLENLNDLRLEVCPAASDESTAIGAALIGYARATGRQDSEAVSLGRCSDSYLGPSFTSHDALDVINQSSLPESVSVEEHENIEDSVAQLLADDHIVARFAGRMEIGPRALGNRSILAHPSHVENVIRLNQRIKHRDFWMPFAPSILAEDMDTYAEESSRAQATAMMMAFRGTGRARQDFAAAVHAADESLRAQKVERTLNPRYHALITYFKERTGVGGVLNTSFNLHGEPIVCTPTDAIDTFLRSGLTHLALEDYLLVKN